LDWGEVREIVCQLLLWVTQSSPGENGFNLLPMKIDSGSEKKRQTKHLSSPFSRLNFTPSVRSPPPTPPSSAAGDGGCSQYITDPLSLSFHLILFLCSSVGTSTSCSPTEEKTCSGMRSSQATVQISAPVWAFPRAARASLLQHLECLLPSFFSCRSACTAVSHSLFFFPSLPVQHLCPFLNMLSQMCHTWLMGLAASCGESVGAGWNQLCPAWGCQPPPTPPCTRLATKTLTLTLRESHRITIS